MENKEAIIKDILDFNKWIYSLTGFGNTQFPGKFQKIFYICYRTCVQVAFCVQLCLMYHEIIIFSSNLAMLSFNLSFAMFGSVGVVKIVIMNVRRKEVEEMQKRLKENLHLPWVGKEEWENEVRSKYTNIIIIVNKIMYTLVAIGAFVTAALPLATNSKQKFFLPLSYNFLEKTVYYTPIYVFHIFITSIFLINFISNDMIYIGLLIRVCENFEIIEVVLKRFTTSYNFFESNGSSSDKRNDRAQSKMIEESKILVRRCIIHHQAVLRELKLITDIYSLPVVLHFIFGPFLCGFLAYVIFSDLDQDEIIIQQIVYVLPAGVYLFVFCYFGTQISDKSNDVRFAFYSSPWYDFDHETKKSVIIVLLGFIKSGKLTAGKMFDVALTTYLTLGKTAYNFVTLLRNTS